MEKSSEFDFPIVEVGDTVLFMGTLGAGDKVYPMLVEAVGDCTVDGAVWNGENQQWEQRNGCRHVDDPWLKDPFNANVINEEADTGVFLISPTVRDLRRTVAELSDSVSVCLDMLRKSGKDPDKAVATVKAKREKSLAAKKADKSQGPLRLNDFIGLRAPEPKVNAENEVEDEEPVGAK